MSDSVIRDHSFTVRLSAEEKAGLEALADRFELDKSAAVRKALQLALVSGQPLPRVGQFVPIHAEDVAFPVRLSGKIANDG